ncbi:MAG: hypothetical protein R3F43_31650 [bacterium]
MATRISAAVVRTTHMSGIVTDLGIALGKALAGRGVTSLARHPLPVPAGWLHRRLRPGVELHHGLADAGLYAIAGVLVTAGGVFHLADQALPGLPGLIGRQPLGQPPAPRWPSKSGVATSIPFSMSVDAPSDTLSIHIRGGTRWHGAPSRSRAPADQGNGQ